MMKISVSDSPYHRAGGIDNIGRSHQNHRLS